MPQSSRHRSHRSHRRGGSADRSESEGEESALVAVAREEAAAAATVSRDPEPERRRSSSGKEAERKRKVDAAWDDHLVDKRSKIGHAEVEKLADKSRRSGDESKRSSRRAVVVDDRAEEVAAKSDYGKRRSEKEKDLRSKESTGKQRSEKESDLGSKESTGKRRSEKEKDLGSKESTRHYKDVRDRECKKDRDLERNSKREREHDRLKEQERDKKSKESTGHYKDVRDRECKKDRDLDRNSKRETEHDRLKEQERDKKDYDSKHERYEDGGSRKFGSEMSRTEEEGSRDTDVNSLKDTDSSQYSSPLRRPKSLLVEKTTSNGEIVYEYNSDPEVVDAYYKDLDKYHEKLARQQQLPTLKQSNYGRNITDWDNLKQKNAILDVAESVLRLSSSHDGKAINTCNGIIFEWDESDKSAIIVTSSQILASKVSLDDWEDNNVYVPNAKVTAHLLDGTISDLTLLHLSKHYELAFFKIEGASKLPVALLEPEIEFGSEACVLGRENDSGLICRRTRIIAMDPCDHQRNHYLFIGDSIPESCTGGSLADFNQKVVGMVVNALPNFAFIPSSIITRCFQLWKSCKIIARPHLGLKLRTVQFLDITHLEQLSRDFKIKAGLIVGKVSSQSVAERNGFRTGDVIFSCQGQSVSTISEFEGILLDICEKQFKKGNGLNGEVDVEIGIHNLRKPAMKRMVTLSVKPLDCMEVFN